MRPRVGIVGARRVRQGLGPFVVRDLLAAGAEVPCILATREETRDAALQMLSKQFGVDSRGYLALDAMLAREALDALAILSPAECHAEALAAAARAGLHVLCEKPFVWGVPDPVGRARALTHQVESGGGVVFENCQWPYTLRAFAALHPGACSAPPRRFEMALQPASRGLQSLADALPHPLSLLQALVPARTAQIEDVCFSTRDAASAQQIVSFRYCAGGHVVETQVRLASTETQPRQASLALDGRAAHRVVAPADYRLSWVDANRSAPMDDPLTQLVADFVAAMRHTPGADSCTQRKRSAEIVQRMQLLMVIADAYRDGGSD
jgi:Oxidoreductase family, NAD-binding Rossmann fold